MMSEKKSLFDDPKFKEIQEKYQQAMVEYDYDCQQYWDSLDYEDQLKAFYSVCKRIHKGDVKDQGTYRYVLYDVFGFGPDAYGVGMECGYMDIHNFIVTGVEAEKVKHANRDDDSQSSDL